MSAVPKKHHSAQHHHHRQHSASHRAHHHSVIETTPAPSTSEEKSQQPSAFAKLRVILLLVVLVVLLAVLYLVWTLFQSEQRAQYVITGEELFKKGVIDRIVRQGPSEPAPPPPTTQTSSQEVQLVEQRANTPSTIAQGPQTYYIRTSGSGPTITQLDISEFDPAVGSTQGIRVAAQHSAPIDTITATLQTDQNRELYNLSVIEGDATKGTWAVQWPVTDTHDVNYTLILEAASAGFPTSRIELSFR